MANCKRQSDENALVFYARLLSLLWLCFICQPSGAHFIQIDHEEFRASGYPHPPLPPPIPAVEHLPQHILPAKELSPAEFMVDLSNDLTYRILHYHSILNRNNFAFSPTALVSVLVALYEGSAGRSSLELRNVLQLPNNRDIIRVGYRDIHRRLRTYFFGSDNPLKGLSLNKDNVTITRDYETVLMFYGYDLGMDMVSSTTAPTTTTTTTTTMPTMAESTTTTAAVMQGETTTTANMETTKETETTTIASTTMEPTTTMPMTTAEGTTVAATVTTTTTTATTTTAPETTTESTATTTAIPETTTEIETTTPETPATTTEEAATTTETPEITTTAEAPAAEGKANEDAELVSAFVAEADAEPFQRIQKARVSRLPSARLQAPSRTAAAATPRTNYLPTSARQVGNSASARPSRNKRHLFGFKELDTSLFVTLFNPHPQHSLLPISDPASGPALAQLTNEYEAEEFSPHFLTAGETKQNYNTDVISHVFYLGNQQLVHTTFKVYNAVLYYKYFDNLKMSVLELELDTPEYNLMILLPDYHIDLVTAAASLRLGPTLRLMRKQLKPKWVQAIIPDFRLHGTMFLTNDLQNMGICDVFEPNRADFRPMTDEKGIYVKHIEQSINVNIRTRPINQLKRNYGAQTQPIQISVNHPFLFFIIDRDLDVAVMAGRILNPLNVRIQ